MTILGSWLALVASANSRWDRRGRDQWRTDHTLAAHRMFICTKSVLCVHQLQTIVTSNKGGRDVINLTSHHRRTLSLCNTNHSWLVYPQSTLCAIATDHRMFKPHIVPPPCCHLWFWWYICFVFIILSPTANLNKQNKRKGSAEQGKWNRTQIFHKYIKTHECDFVIIFQN